MEQPLIQFTDVTYRYRAGEPALRGLDLQIEAGAFVALAGASGSGKSTLCRLLNGLIPHLHGGELTGEVIVAGHHVRATAPAVLSREVGLVLQNPDAQCFGATVARDIAFGPACQGLDRSEIAARVHEAAALTGAAHLLDRAPHTLSGGEQQRVALAGVLALRPKLLVLDEPFAFLDAWGVDSLRANLHNLHRRGVTIVVAEHRLADVVADATRIIVLAHGQIVADGQPKSVVSHDLAGWGLDAPVTIEPARSAAFDVVSPLSGKVEPGPEPDAIDTWPSQERRTSNAEPVVEWDDVWFERDGHPVLRGVNLTAVAGDRVALLGPNGAGKTTLLHHANGLLRPHRGTVRVLGRPVGRRTVSELAQTVGLVVQQPERMFFAPTVRDEIAAGPRALGRVDQAWCAQLIDRLGLTSLLDRVPQRLSAGEQRRVALASVLAARPRALMLDEPTAGQDAAGRRSLETLLRDSTATGTAVVLATHDTDWALSLCAWWAVLAEGRIVADGTPVEVCARPEILALAHLRLPRIMRLHGMGEMPDGSRVLRS